MMSFMDATKSCFQQYVGFSGRASRSEYWWFVLATGIAGFVAGFLDAIIFGPELSDPGGSVLLLTLVCFFQYYALSSEDCMTIVNLVGMFLWVLTGIGTFYILYLMIVDGEAHDNAYGAVPTNTL